MKKGKNGQQIAEENIALVKSWIEERNKRRDWNEYAFNKRINRRVLSEELDFAKSVCTQNKAVRKLLESADEVWFKTGLEVDHSARKAARERAEKRINQTSSSNNALSRRVAELEAENRKLRQELATYKKQRALIEDGAPGFRI